MKANRVLGLLSCAAMPIALVLTAGGCQTGGDGGGSGQSGGTTSSGGSDNQGGSSSTGGSSNAGGNASAGGSPGTGGSSNNGGSSTAKGGAGAGGAVGSGGAIGSGGADPNGGATAPGGAGGTAGRTTSRTGGTAGGGTSGSGVGGSSARGGTTGTVPTTLPPAEDFTDKIGSASVEMVYIPGGTFTLGCDSGSCDPDTSPVENITVSDYHIMKAEAPRALWTAANLTEGTWYDCMALACELGKQTGKAYRMMTEAEFEYAAKKHLDKLSGISATEEWAFNSWETKYSCKAGDVDPLGPSPGAHTQKTRRDKATGDKITGRLIRSIDGIGPKCRLTVSAKTAYPPGYPQSCSVVPPVECVEPPNSYRDPRWVTGDSAKWKAGSLKIGNFDLQVWDDGTAVMNGKTGQWFTSNNIAFVFVPSSGTAVKYPYIFLDCNQGSVISDTSFMSGGFVGRYEKTTATGTKPSVSGLKSGEELAAAAGADYKMVDMENVPEADRKQDARLLDTPSDCWFQNNQSAGGTHNYRKDVDASEFRFAVIDKGQIVMLANGKWWTVNNTFLHIEHPDGYVAEYLYAITSDGYFLHNSFMAYERADFRMFQKYDNATGKFPPTCVPTTSCSNELAKGAAQPFYATMADGGSTYKPAKCPADGCK